MLEHKLKICLSVSIVVSIVGLDTLRASLRILIGLPSKVVPRLDTEALTFSSVYSAVLVATLST